MKVMAKSSGGYFGMGKILSIIFAIIPVTSIIFGIIIRAQKGNVLGVVLNILLCPIFWIVDLVTICAKNKLTFLA